MADLPTLAPSACSLSPHNTTLLESALATVDLEAKTLANRVADGDWLATLVATGQP